MAPSAPRYHRVMVKLSGEALMGSQPFGIEPSVVRAIAGEIADVAALGTQVSVVVGGGNIIRGVSAHEQGIDRITPSGIVETRRLPGSGAGPSPDRLWIGSEGTLGVITEAWMRLQDRPRFRA